MTHMPAWARDHNIWLRAKKAALADHAETDDNFYAIVTSIYKKMGGRVSSSVTTQQGDVIRASVAERVEEQSRKSEDNMSDNIKATGTSEGAKKGWEKRGHELSLEAWQAHEQAHDSGSAEDHAKAEVAHSLAAEHWKQHGNERRSFLHTQQARAHNSSLWKNFSTKSAAAIASDIVHCRLHSSAAGDKLGASAPWKCGEPVEFMFMPAGVHTITAGFRSGSIELTVQCDEATAEAVQASLERWREERPKQEPFGCVEHREHEASVRVSASGGFKWKEDGVYLAAEPTTLGAENVNGKVHRSWSPSFTTDADYDQAKEVKGSGGQVTLVFPEGVRGSRSNPAAITGVDFCVGTLTNKPAFHAMSPVKSSEAVTAAGTSEGAKEQKPTVDSIAAEHAAKREKAETILAKQGCSRRVTLEDIERMHGKRDFTPARATKTTVEEPG